MSPIRNSALLVYFLIGLPLNPSVSPLGASLESVQLECSICLEALFASNLTTNITDCGHRFHSECIIDWVQRGHVTCPMCRGEIGNTLRRYLPEAQKATSARAFVVFTAVWCLGVVVFLGTKASVTSHQTYTGVLTLSLVVIFVWFYILISGGVHMENVDPLIDLLHR